MPNNESRSGGSSDLPFVRRVLILFALAALAMAAWVLLDILLLLFAAVLVALILHALAAPLERSLSLTRRPAMLLAGVLGILFLVGTGFVLGPGLAAELTNLARTLPESAKNLLSALHLGSMAELVKDGATVSALGGLASRMIAWTSTAAGALGSLLLVLFGGIYLANEPRLYRDGLIKLFPPAVHENVSATLDDAGEALRRWLAGQAIAMAIVGGFTAIGL